MSLTHANEFLNLNLNCEMQIICELFKFWKFISFEPQIRKMQIICQNTQERNIYLLVPLVKLFGQIKLPLFDKYRNGRI